MLKPEEKAIDLFNRSLKQCIQIGIAPTKENAKELAFVQILSIKEALYDCSLLDSTSTKKSLERWQNINSVIEKL